MVTHLYFGMNILEKNHIFYAPLPSRNIGKVTVRRYLCQPKDKRDIEKLLCKSGYLNAPYLTHSRKNGYIYLYPMVEPNLFVGSKGSIEIVYQLSINAYSLVNAMLPLDKSINEGLFERCTYNEKQKCYEVDPSDLICYIIAECIFDKKDFDDDARVYIDTHGNELASEITLMKLRGVFFAFTPTLIGMLQKREYDSIMDGFFRFADY